KAMREGLRAVANGRREILLHPCVVLLVYRPPQDLAELLGAAVSHERLAAILEPRKTVGAQIELPCGDAGCLRRDGEAVEQRSYVIGLALELGGVLDFVRDVPHHAEEAFRSVTCAAKQAHVSLDVTHEPVRTHD